MMKTLKLRSVYCSVVSLLVFGFVASGIGFVARGADTSHELGKIKPKQLNEISGLAASRQNLDLLWLHNDGDSGLVFGVTTTGKLAGLVSSPVDVEDFEDIAIGPGPEAGADYLYLGDIGDNDERRRAVRVVRFAEPKLGDGGSKQFDVEEAEAFLLTYSDGAHNAEALFVDPVTGDLFVVTKEKGQARLYTVSADRLNDEAAATLAPAGTLAANEVSAGDISPDGSRIVLRREAQGWLWRRHAGESVAAAMQRPPQRVPVLGKRQGPNGESIAFGPDGNSYYTVSEGKKQSIYEFDLPAAATESGR